MKTSIFPALFARLIIALISLAPVAQASTPHAVSPYKLAVFATAPAGLSAPDSLAVLGDHVFIGYGDGHAPDGSDGLNSQVVEYTLSGSIVHIYTVPGHNDGLKVDPLTQRLWALQNEDANPNLVIIDTETGHEKLYKFGPTLHGGGYDDIVFRGCQIFISASNAPSERVGYKGEWSNVIFTCPLRTRNAPLTGWPARNKTVPFGLTVGIESLRSSL